MWTFVGIVAGLGVIVANWLAYSTGNKKAISLGDFVLLGVIGALVGGLIGLILYLLRRPALWFIRNFDYIGSLALFVFTIVALSKALSYPYRYHTGPARWWFAGTIASFGLLGLAIAWTVGRRSAAVPNQPSPLALGVLLAYPSVSWIGALIFPLPLGRALYKVKHGDDFTITRVRKPRTQHQYKTVGFTCGRCGRSLSGQVSQCPYCGVRFGGTQNRYLGNTPPPKRTTRTTRKTTGLAGVLVYLWLLLNMVFVAALFAIKHALTWQETLALALPALVVLLLVDLAIVGIALLVRRRCVKLNGGVTRETFY